MTMREARERSAGKRRRGDDAGGGGGGSAAAAAEEEPPIMELHSPTAQEIAEFLNVEMSPRAPRPPPGEGAAGAAQQQQQQQQQQQALLQAQLLDEAGSHGEAGGDRQVVETLTEQDTVEDGWRCAHLPFLSLNFFFEKGG
jgi:hypothetical protein